MARKSVMRLLATNDYVCYNIMRIVAEGRLAYGRRNGVHPVSPRFLRRYEGGVRFTQSSSQLRTRAAESHPGIYTVTGNISIATQIVVTSRLPQGEYTGLKLLAYGCTKESLIEYAEQAIASDNEKILTNAEAVIRVCLQANRDLGKKLEGDRDMEDIFSKFVKRKLSEARSDGIKEGIAGNRKEVATDMIKSGFSLSSILQISKLPEATIHQLAKSLGVAVL